MPLVDVVALALDIPLVPVDAEPLQVVFDEAGVFCTRALRVDVLDAENEASALAAGREPRHQCGVDVAEVHASGRRGGETSGDCMIHVGRVCNDIGDVSAV